MIIILLLFQFRNIQSHALIRSGRASMSMVLDTATRTILVLGGTGFVGSEIVSHALKNGFRVVSLSRRGVPDELKPPLNEVCWEKGDATSEEMLNLLTLKYGPFYACIHAIGLLLDTESGLSSLNKYASGSGSIPTTESTYDNITRKTAYVAIESLVRNTATDSLMTTPFVFISAAEAKWEFRVPVPWLEKYLIAKRAVEYKLLQSKNLRPVIFRPSLIWTKKRPQALVSVVPFYVGNIFAPYFIDKPVSVESLAKAVIKSLDSPTVSGIQTYKEIEMLSQSCATNKL